MNDHCNINTKNKNISRKNKDIKFYYSHIQNLTSLFFKIYKFHLYQ